MLPVDEREKLKYFAKRKPFVVTDCRRKKLIYMYICNFRDKP